MSHSVNEDSSSKNKKTPGEISKETLSQIVSCFEKGDKAGLKELMSDYIIANDSQLDNEIADAFDFIDGKIVSYDNPFADAMGSREKKSFGGETTGIITEHGTEYKIAFTGWITYEEDESRIGIEGIRVVNVTERLKYPPEANGDKSPGCRVKIGHFE